MVTIVQKELSPAQLPFWQNLPSRLSPRMSLSHGENSILPGFPQNCSLRVSLPFLLSHNLSHSQPARVYHRHIGIMDITIMKGLMRLKC